MDKKAYLVHSERDRISVEEISLISGPFLDPDYSRLEPDERDGYVALKTRNIIWATDKNKICKGQKYRHRVIVHPPKLDSDGALQRVSVKYGGGVILFLTLEEAKNYVKALLPKWQKCLQDKKQRIKKLEEELAAVDLNSFPKEEYVSPFTGQKV